MDGWIRIWFYETIDQADSRTEERFLEIQPIYEYHVNEVNNSMLMCIRKQEPDNPESMFWYAQVRLNLELAIFRSSFAQRLRHCTLNIMTSNKAEQLSKMSI